LIIGNIFEMIRGYWQWSRRRL